MGHKDLRKSTPHLSQQGAEVMEKAVVRLWTQNVKTWDLKEEKTGVEGWWEQRQQQECGRHGRKKADYATMIFDMLYADLKN